jgi:hypothetical protein
MDGVDLGIRRNSGKAFDCAPDQTVNFDPE